MRWFIFIAAILFAPLPGYAYKAAGAAPASFSQPFSEPAAAVPEENPARRALLDKIDAEIARYKKEGNQAKVAELTALRASVEGAASDEELAVWSRKLDSPAKEAFPQAPVIGQSQAVVEAPPSESVAEAPLAASGERAAAAAAQEVSDAGTDEGGLQSLFDGGKKNPAADKTAEAPVPPVSSPQASPPPAVGRQDAPPAIGPGREVFSVVEYPRPKNIPMKWQPPPNPDAQRDTAKPASLPELEEMARRHGIPLEIFRQAYAEARRQNVDYRLVLAVMKQESRFKPTAKSRAGARGLMQVMPATGRDMGVKDANMLYDVKTSIYAGTRYIRTMWNMFVDKGAAIVKSFDPGEVARVKNAIAAYNAGPGNVQDAGGIPPFKETRDYVVKVLGNYYGYMREFPPAVGPKA